MRRRYFPDDANWKVEQGSALDQAYLQPLGKFDIVYSWGVLHHTGSMWLGIDNAIKSVAEGGQLFIAIYNDQGFKSHVWWIIKWLYNKTPRPLNTIYAYGLGLLIYLLKILKYTFKLQPMTAIRSLLDYKTRRGMSITHDLVDWVGGLPFEFARYDVLDQYIVARGFRLERGEKTSSLGCHEMVFRKTA